MIRTRTDLAIIIDQQPFEDTTDENMKRYVTFLSEEPGDEQIHLPVAENEAEEFAVHGREVYSEVQKDRLENGRFTDVGDKLGIPATRRTWDVVTKVYELAN